MLGAEIREWWNGEGGRKRQTLRLVKHLFSGSFKLSLEYAKTVKFARKPTVFTYLYFITIRTSVLVFSILRVDIIKATL